MNKIYILIFMSLNIIAQEPPQQIVPSSVAHRQEARSLHADYTYSDTFLMKSSLVVLAGTLLAGYGEYVMCDSDNQNKSSKKLAAFAATAGINLLCVGCGGCFVYCQERCCDIKHHAD